MRRISHGELSHSFGNLHTQSGSFLRLRGGGHYFMTLYTLRMLYTWDFLIYPVLQNTRYYYFSTRDIVYSICFLQPSVYVHYYGGKW